MLKKNLQRLCPLVGIDSREVARLWIDADDTEDDPARGFRSEYSYSWLSHVFVFPGYVSTDLLVNGSLKTSGLWERFVELAGHRSSVVLLFKFKGLSTWAMHNLVSTRVVYGAPRITIPGKTRALELSPFSLFFKEHVDDSLVSEFDLEMT